MIQALIEQLATKEFARDLSNQQLDLLVKHLAAVLEQNKTMNLTSIKSIDQGALLHIEDSLLGLEEAKSAPEGRLADLGSGAGYPGIPLALITGRTTALVEARKKKAEFLIKCIHALGLEGKVTAHPERIEKFASAHAAKFSVVTARALTALSSLIELASPLLAPEGRLIAYKGSPSLEELKTGNKVADIVGLSLSDTKEAFLSDGITKRCILIYTKTSESKIDLPRRDGLAQKNPLK